MSQIFNSGRRACMAAGAIAAMAWLAQSSSAGSLGINFQGNNFNFGPYSVSAEVPASAWGVPGDDWYEPGPVPVGGPTVFNPASGGSVTISYSAYPLSAYTAYGWANANEAVNNGDPQSGEAAVLAGFIFALSNAENGGNGDIPIVVTISGLNSIAAAYNVKVAASSDWTVAQYTPAVVDDGTTNEVVDLTAGILANHPRWNGEFFSTGAVSDAANVFHGDTLTITLTGPNESGTFQGADYLRTALSGIVITPAVPEPSSWVLAGIGMLAVVGFVHVRRKS